MNKENYNFLLKPFFFVVTLLVATSLILWIERLKPSDMGDYQTVFQREILISKSGSYPLRKIGNISSEEMNYSRIAWQYFENNYNDSTGLINGTNRNPAFTVADLGSYIMALTSAYELAIIDSIHFDQKIKKLCQGINNLKVLKQTLPNKSYSAATLGMLNEDGNPSATGTGWSALDIGRFMSGANKINGTYPQYHELLKKSISRWKIENMLTDGYLYEGKLLNNGIKKIQEGTLGSEEYCAKNLLMAGYDAANALSYTDFIKFVPVYNSQIAVDTRGIKNQPQSNYITSEPFILDGLENGWDNNSKELAFRVYSAQKERYRDLKIVTALGIEPGLNNETYLNCLYTDGNEWTCIDKKGAYHNELKSISTKAAFGWYGLFNDDYTQSLINAVKHLNDPAEGWYCGKFESSGKINKQITAETNAMILETINYKKNGKLIRF